MSNPNLVRKLFKSQTMKKVCLTLRSPPKVELHVKGAQAFIANVTWVRDILYGRCSFQVGKKFGLLKHPQAVKRCLSFKAFWACKLLYIYIELLENVTCSSLLRSFCIVWLPNTFSLSSSCSSRPTTRRCERSNQGDFRLMIIIDIWISVLIIYIFLAEPAWLWDLFLGYKLEKRVRAV